MSTETNETVVESLNTLLSDYAVYYQKLRNYHWNVKGKRFFQLHEEFETLYNQSSTHVDAIAERIARLSDRPLSTYEEFLNHARLDEDPSRPASNEMVRNLIADIESLNGYSAEAASVAEEDDDRATANMLEDIIEVQEENAWMLSSWLAE